MFLQKRNVFLVELFLQRFRRRRNHYAASAANCGQQIRERFPRAGPGFHNRVMPVLKRVVHHFRHFKLCNTMLIPANHRSFEQSTRTENFSHVYLSCHRLAGLPRIHFRPPGVPCHNKHFLFFKRGVSTLRLIRRLGCLASL